MTVKATKEQRELLIPENKPEVQKVDGEPTKIIGYAVRWDQLSHPILGLFQEKFERGAFAESLINPDVYASWQHDSREILGRTPNTLTLFEDEVGLRYEIVPPNWAEKYVETIERGDVRGSSFIFKVADKNDEVWDNETNPNMPVRSIRKAKLFEVSPVTTPAYPQSSVGIRSVEEVYNDHFNSGSVDDSEERQAAIQLDFEMRLKKLNL